MSSMRDNLIRLQAFQIKAYDAGLNMRIDVREADNAEKSWIVGHVKKEGVDFGDEDHCLDFYFYDWTGLYGEKWKAATYKEEFEKINKFIVEHTTIGK